MNEKEYITKVHIERCRDENDLTRHVNMFLSELKPEDILSVQYAMTESDTGSHVSCMIWYKCIKR